MATCSLDTYLDGLARQLKDCTFTPSGTDKHVRWTREHLLWIVCIAANQIRADRGDLFLEDKRIKLDVGCYTDVCTQGAFDIRSPIILEGNECERITVDSDVNQGWANDFFPSLSCTPSSGDTAYTIESIEIDPEDPCKIRVSPAVPDDGVQRYIIARATKDIVETIENGELPQGVCENLHAFTQLVLAYAYGMDGMVNVDGSQWKDYHSNYENIIQASFIRDLSLRDKRILYGQVARNLGN